MKSYLSLIPISARTRRKQNRLILICIVLAVFLVTSVFSLAEIMAKGEEASMIKKHGNHHVIVSGISEEQAGEIAAQGDVEELARCRAVGEEDYENYRIGDRRVILYGTEQSYVSGIRNYETEGTYPQKNGEVMLNSDAKERLGAEIGSTVVIHTPAGDFPGVVTGFCVDEWALEQGKFDGVCAYMGTEMLREVCGPGDGGDGLSYYIRFSGDADLRDAIAAVAERYPAGKIEENLVTVGMSGASSREEFNRLYGLAAAVFVLILTAGVLMISSCMNSNVSQRTKFFGMMRCVGASRAQIMRFVRLEALNWCKTAIPAGTGLGLIVTWILCIVLKNLGGEFSEFRFRISVTGIVSGALVGVVTVLLAAHAPAKRAAAVSPMAAVSGSVDTGKTGSHGANTRRFKVDTALGIHHAMAAKKNLILMSLSFAFTIVLFLSFFAVLDFVRRILPSASDLSPDFSIAAADNTNSLGRGMKEEIAGISGVEAVFGCAYALDTAAEVNDTAGRVDLISYDEYLLSWSKKSVVSGDLSKVTGDCNYALTIYNQDSRLDVGDRIRIGDTELTIACVVSEGIGTESRPSVVCTEETFSRITGESNYIMLNVQLEKGAQESTADAILAAAGENEFVDRREENQEGNTMFFVFRLGVYSFLGIIALIMMFNIINSISMSVSARIRQYGAMRAVGMSVGQVMRMVAAEAATYAVCGSVIGCAAGLYVHRLITKLLLLDHFGGTWSIPAEALAIVTMIVVISCVIAVRVPAKRIRNMAVTETINEL